MQAVLQGLWGPARSKCRMSNPGTHDAPEQKPDPPPQGDWRRGRLVGVAVAYAFGAALTIAWIVFLVWVVAQIV